MIKSTIEANWCFCKKKKESIQKDFVLLTIKMRSFLKEKKEYMKIAWYIYG